MARVSVILPTFNRAYCLPRAVGSLVAQDYTDWELILVDDGSTDETADLRLRFARELGAQYRDIVLPNRGVSTARNKGLAIADGEFVAFLDSDDVWVPEKLGMQVGTLEREPDASFCYSDFFTFDDGLNIINPRHSVNAPLVGHIYPELLGIERNIITCPSVVARRAAVGASGMFDEGMRICEDLDLWVRLARDASVAMVNLPLVGVHVRDGTSFDYAGSFRGRYDLHKRALARDSSLQTEKRIGWYREIFATYVQVAALRGHHDVEGYLRQVETAALTASGQDAADALLGAMDACAVHLGQQRSTHPVGAANAGGVS